MNTALEEVNFAPCQLCADTHAHAVGSQKTPAPVAGWGWLFHSMKVSF